MDKYNAVQLAIDVDKAVSLIKNHHFPVMASRVWDIFRANYPLSSVVQYWNLRPDQGNPPDFNEALSFHPDLERIQVRNKTYYMFKD